jgi:hypothetical protein
MSGLHKRTALGWSFALVGALALAAGCSGTAVNYSNPHPATPAPLTSVAVTIALPLAAAGPLRRGARRAGRRGTESLDASNVGSVTVQAALSGTQAPSVTIDTTAGSPNCGTSNSTLTCTGSVQAPIGSDVTFAVVAFGQTNAQGSPLAGGTIVQNVTTGTTLTIGSTVLDAFNFFIASLTVALNNSTFNAGTPGTFTFSFNAYDATGALIAAPANFANPIALSIPPSLSNGVFGFIPTPGATPNYFGNAVPPVTAAGVSLSFGYSGLAPGFSPGANVFTFPVTVAGVAPGQITGSTNVTVLVPSPSPAPSLLTPTPIPTTAPSGVPTTTPSPLPTYTPGPIQLTPSALYFAEPTAPPQTFTASEQGVTTFHAEPLDPTIASVSPSNGTNFTVTPLNPGLTLIVVTDSNGNANGVAVYINQIIINPQTKAKRINR